MFLVICMTIMICMTMMIQFLYFADMTTSFDKGENTWKPKHSRERFALTSFVFSIN